MKRNNLVRVAALTVAIIFLGIINTTNSVNAENNNKNDVIGQSSKMFNTEVVNRPLKSKLLEIDKFYISESYVEISRTGESVFLDAVGEVEKDKFVNLSQDAKWTSANSDIVTAYAGRLIARNAGSTTVTITYGNYEEAIEVSVLESFDIAEELDRLKEEEVNENSSFALTAGDRDKVYDRAYSMVEYGWTPTKDLIGWKNQYTFNKNVKVLGIPYSQTEYQKNLADFKLSLSSSDFYNAYTRFSITMPKYGNDCSGFVSFAWDISRKTTADFVSGIKNGTYSKVGTYDASNPTKSDLKAAYKNMKYGDALVKEGHVFLVSNNSSSTGWTYVFEQTPPQSIHTSWSYESLANGGYMPFTLK